MLQRKHIAVDEIQVTALFSRDPIHVFKFPDIIGGHPAVLASCGIAIHAAGIVTSEETLQIELHEILTFLVFGQ